MYGIVTVEIKLTKIKVYHANARSDINPSLDRYSPEDSYSDRENLVENHFFHKIGYLEKLPSGERSCLH